MKINVDHHDILTKPAGVSRVLKCQHFLDDEKSKDIITGVVILLSFQCFISNNSIRTLINSDAQKNEAFKVAQ